jgi:hypothetical protein
MRGWRFLLVARTASILVALAAVVSGALAFRNEIPRATSPAESVFSPAFREQLRIVENRVPAGAPVLHISAQPEPWFSRLWQRGLYPRNPIIVIQPWDYPRLAELRTKYATRFAVSAGKPPLDPGFAWKVDLGAVPGLPGATWFGELAP